MAEVVVTGPFERTNLPAMPVGDAEVLAT
jgi:hypothetical protein